MVKIVKFEDKNEILSILSSRQGVVNSDILTAAEKIIEDVRRNRDEALFRLTEKFDGIKLQCLKVSAGEMEEGFDLADAGLKKALRTAYDNIWDFHSRQVQKSWMMTKKDDIVLGQKIRPLKRVGIYVPGGTAAYPSTVLMNAVPAKVAGVEQIIMITPPSKDGRINANILAAAKIADVDQIYKVGGAQGIAALALGTETIPKADKITGPGNIYVATAKRLLFGTVDIDMIAGPSEILVIADDMANPKFIAADMLSQAEHDPLASAMCIVLSLDMAQKVQRQLEIQKKKLPRGGIIESSLEGYAKIIVCADLKSAISLSNEIAPEHLELMVENPLDYIDQIENAGSVFLGDYSPEALGDYMAGPNHVLPTNGTARFFSSLSVDSFIKKINFTSYSKKALKNVKDEIMTIALKEGLEAHGASVSIRFGNRKINKE